MPKTPTYPTLLDTAHQVSITKLKQWKYLEPEKIKSGIISWSRRGEKIASISIQSNLLATRPFIELSYTWRDQSINDKIYLVKKESNLGKGYIWYFLCPRTGKRCRILYSIGAYFSHRVASSNGMYECQTYSKHMRQLYKMVPSEYEAHQLYAEVNSKHFKKFYRGKPTRRYQRIRKKLYAYENMDLETFEKAMMGVLKF